jgi:hypothetical protein
MNKSRSFSMQNGPIQNSMAMPWKWTGLSMLSELEQKKSQYPEFNVGKSAI